MTYSYQYRFCNICRDRYIESSIIGINPLWNIFVRNKKSQLTNLVTLRCTVTCCKHVSTRSHWKLHELRAEHAHQYLFSTSLTLLVSFGNHFGLRPTWISPTYARLHQHCKSHHLKVAISYFSSKGFLADMLGEVKNSGFPEDSLFPFLNPRVQFVST